MLPRPYDDELIGSVLARGLVHTGLSTKKLIHRLTGRRASTFSFFLPPDLAAISLDIAQPASAVLRNHTIFPFVTALMPAGEAARLEAKALSGGSREHSLSSLVGSVTRGVKGLRYCPRCMAEDLRERGESYWRRSHNLPAVYVCYRHGTSLRQTPTPSLTRAFEVGLPHHQREDATVRLTSPEAAHDVAARCAGFLVSRNDCVGDPASTYRQQAIRAGYVLASGDCAGLPLARDMLAHFGPQFLRDAGCEIALDSRDPWPALMLRPAQGVAFAAVKHVLLQHFLGRRHLGVHSLGYAAPGKPARDYRALDTQLAAHIRKTVRQAQLRNIRVAVATLAHGTGLWSSYRHHRELFPQSRAALDDFRRSDAALRQHGRRPCWRKRLA